MKDEAMLFERVIIRDSEKWLKYIDNLKKPNDDFDRVENHDRAIRYITDCVDNYENFRFDALSFILFLPSVISSSIYTLFCNLFNKKSRCYDCIKIVESRDNSASSKRFELPKEIENEVDSIYEYKVKRKIKFFTGKVNKLTFQILIRLIKRNPLAFYTNLSVFAHLGLINGIIKEYAPKMIITMESENDNTSSLMTYACEKQGVEYINLMHGDTWVNPMHCNVRFSRFYVWDPIYIEQYVRTGSPRESFRLYSPERFELNINPNIDKDFFLTYYLQGQEEDTLKKIRDILVGFQKRGKKCCIRCHPRATDVDAVKAIFMNSGISEEDYNSISLKQSFERTEYVVSSYSTVLSEAFENKVKCAIDDVTDTDTFITLKKLLYINAERLPYRLSKLIQNN